MRKSVQKAQANQHRRDGELDGRKGDARLLRSNDRSKRSARKTMIEDRYGDIPIK